MSASNWAICPVCQKKAVDDLAKRAASVFAGYGKVPVEQFMSDMALLRSVILPKCETFREEYQQGIDEDGNYSVSYSGGCHVCNSLFEFKHEVENAVPGSKENRK